MPENSSEAWCKEHTRSCKKQSGMKLRLDDGTVVTLCAGYTENYYGTVGNPYDDGSSVCNGCGAFWCGRVYHSPSAEARARKRGEYKGSRTGGGKR